MQLADPAAVTKTVSPLRPAAVAERNQATYDRIKLSLSLRLRRQIFLAVCDDLTLRNRLVTQLHTDMTGIPLGSPAIDVPKTAEAILAELLQELPSELAYPDLVSLTLSLTNPNPIAQIADWLIQYPPPVEMHEPRRVPSFQILGVEHLMRQSATIQQRFLLGLQQVERSLSCLESSLVLWLPRPWLHTIQESAPAFWNCHTALFEFEGDPTPSATATVADPAQTASTGELDADPAIAPMAATTVTSEAEQPLELISSGTNGSSVPNDSIAIQQAGKLGLVDAANPPDDLWDILTYDLAMLDDYGAETPTVSELSTSSEPSLEADVAAPVAPAIPLVSEILPLSIADQLSNQANFAATAPAPDLTEAAAEFPPETILQIEPPAEPPPPIITVESKPSFTTSEDPAYEFLSLISQAYPDETLLTLARSPELQAGASATEQSELLFAIERIEQLRQNQVRGTSLSVAYQALGNLYRDRIEQGDISDQILIVTIYAYEQTLANLNDDTLPIWADVLNDMGNLYWMLSRQFTDTGISLAYLEQGISTYNLAIQKTNPQVRAQTYAMIQNNLGSAYGDLARHHGTVDVLQKSVKAYEAALRYRSSDDDPARYAATQNNLGTAYWNLAQQQQPVRHLRQAITAYHEALRYYTPTQEPLHFAMLQNNLGTAYWNLSQHAKTAPAAAAANGNGISAVELLLEAIKAYNAALQYRTLEIAPSANAATQNNLGTAYWHLAIAPETSPSDRNQYLHQAIVAYKAALAAVQFLRAAGTAHAPALTFDSNASQNNLGLAYYQLAIDQQIQQTSEQRASHLEAALHHQLQALYGWAQQPEFYQTAFNYVLQTIRAFHNEFGTQGQNRALSQVPANLLPELLKRL